MSAGTIESAMNRLPGAADDMIKGGGHFLRWRHQRLGDRRIESDNSMGTDPDGMIYETDDYHKMASKQGCIFYAQFIPIRGDLLITLEGYPQTKRQAKASAPIGYYKVKKVKDIRRTNDGDLIYAKVKTKIDNSGQWNGS